MKRISTAVLIALAALGCARSAQATPLPYRDGVDLIERYADTQAEHSVLSCARRSATSVACGVEWRNVEVGEELDPAGEWIAAYGEFWDRVLARRLSTGCVRVWEPIFPARYAATIC